MPTADNLATLLLELIDIPSVSREEAMLEVFVKQRVDERFALQYEHDSVLYFAPERRPNVPLVVLAGHTDTVPIEGNVPGRIDNGRVVGRGASDMKGGLALMLLAADSWRTDCDFDLGLLFFGREELPADANPLPAALPKLPRPDLAILMEPTANAVEAGCQGNLNLDLRFTGVSAHSARPWTGENAAHKAILALQAFAAAEPVDSELQGLTFREVASVTGITSGTARNVLPNEATVQINVRYSPVRSADEAQQLWSDMGVAMGAEVTVISNAAPAPPVVEHPLVQRLLDAGAGDPAPKQAWTNVADFAAIGVPAINFGPGDPALAHKADEFVDIAALEKGFEVLARFLGAKQ